MTSLLTSLLSTYWAARRHAGTHIGYLKARPPSKSGSQRDDYYLYDLELDGEVIVTGSSTPEFDACRILVARGITGTLVVHDAVTKKLRYTVDIEAGAKLTVIENRKRGPSFGKWEPFKSGVANAPPQRQLSEAPAVRSPRRR